ncbi:hypothetical protein PP754_gp011 [Pectobacterium phage Possum]|uniref:Uncharacterized protein n=1 Tax=Pectobacterium phage Possum TaxID=2686301 RepID=A0A7T0Q1L0_9CAUD|nr:hypothetical protein PP754_gp011 [Pectobacterium phage Possum]QPL10852.1 hypothetical protein Possum_00011 [Pectobacterium phage Possum]QPL10954.1 hypothetical protein Horatius_00011 [Pectobacterium phage Horatius]
MLTKHVYAVKRRNEFLPMPKSSRGRGGSYAEPIDPRLAWPRVFRELRHAKIYLTVWLQGQIPCERDYGDGYVETYPGIPIPVATRHREDMEITMLQLHEYRKGDTQFKLMYFLRDRKTGKFLTHKFNSARFMGDEAREFTEEDVYKAQYFKSHLAAHRYLIKWRRGTLNGLYNPAVYNSAVPDFWLSPYGKSQLDERDAQVEARKDLDIEIVIFAYVECK